MIHKGTGSDEHPPCVRGPLRNAKDRHSRHLAEDERHLTDPAARFASVVVGIVNAASVVIFNAARQPG